MIKLHCFGFQFRERDRPARALLRCLDLTGQLVTTDAIHCQNETAQAILGQGGDYLLRLKNNRPGLHQAARAYFADPAVLASLAATATTDAEHGRIEVRRARVSHDLSWLRGPKTSCHEQRMLLLGLACLGMIESTVTRNGKTRTTRHYHLTSRPLAPGAYSPPRARTGPSRTAFIGCST